jgi:hypothetical protein
LSLQIGYEIGGSWARLGPDVGVAAPLPSLFADGSSRVTLG